jgi:hypothetical protein
MMKSFISLKKNMTEDLKIRKSNKKRRREEEKIT